MKRFLLLWRLLRSPSAWAPAPEWSEADARALAGFLQSAPGLRLQTLLRSETVSANERAALSRGSAFDCGWACGFRGLLAFFQSLAAVPAGESEPRQPIPPELSHFIP